MGLTPKEMKIAMDSGKMLIRNNGNRCLLRDGVYVYGDGSIMTMAWVYDDWQIYEEPKQVFPVKCFDRVLVKDVGTDWYARHFEKIQDTTYPFVCTNGKSYNKIAPYEGNEDFATNPDGVKGIWTRDML